MFLFWNVPCRFLVSFNLIRCEKTNKMKQVQSEIKVLKVQEIESWNFMCPNIYWKLEQSYPSLAFKSHPAWMSTDTTSLWPSPAAPIKTVSPYLSSKNFKFVQSYFFSNSRNCQQRSWSCSSHSSKTSCKWSKSCRKSMSMISNRSFT